jgi:antibiotic biosynthesis monooxygenase
VFISVTRLRIRSLWFLPGFISYALRSSNQARSAAGDLGVELLRDARNTYWTCTAWQDEAAMRAFMMAEPHRSAMSKLAEWCNEASVVHWTQDTADLSDWQADWIEAHRRMATEGRRSKVRHPTEAHRDFRIPAPRV